MRIPFPESLSLQSREIRVEAGDAILFWASLLHAGSFDADVRKERRVVQCFDIFPDKDVMEIWMPKMLHVWCPDDDYHAKISEMITYISTIPGVQQIIAKIRVIETAGGNKIRESILPDDVSVLSVEAFRKRIRTYDEFQLGNVYSPSLHVKIPDATPCVNEKIRNEFYRPRTLETALMVIMVVVLAVIAHRRWSRRERV
jgi:hypothetical protein